MVDEKIVRFIRRHHVLTLATTGNDQAPYCSNAFYCYDVVRNMFIFSADTTTLHAQHMELRSRVAASILLETKIVGKIQGVQLCGTAVRADEQAYSAYIKRFPFAAMANLTLWSLTPEYIKFTDNTLGFGKKLIWKA